MPLSPENQRKANAINRLAPHLTNLSDAITQEISRTNEERDNRRKQPGSHDIFDIDPYEQTAGNLENISNTLRHALQHINNLLENPDVKNAACTSEFIKQTSDAQHALTTAYEYMAVIRAMRLKRFLGFQQTAKREHSWSIEYDTNVCRHYHRLKLKINIWRAIKPKNHTPCHLFQEEVPEETLNDERIWIYNPCLRKKTSTPMQNSTPVFQQIRHAQQSRQPEEALDPNPPPDESDHTRSMSTTSTVDHHKNSEIASWIIGGTFAIGITAAGISMSLISISVAGSLLDQVLTSNPIVALGILLPILLIAVAGISTGIALRIKRSGCCSLLTNRQAAQTNANNAPENH